MQQEIYGVDREKLKKQNNMAYDINDAWAQRQAQIEKEREQLKLQL